MKIQKFNESINFEEVEKKLIEKYNNTSVSYDVQFTYGVIDSSVMDNIDKFDDAIYYMDEGKKRSAYKDSYFYIIKKTTKVEIVPREEIELYRSSNKYNL